MKTLSTLSNCQTSVSRLHGKSEKGIALVLVLLVLVILAGLVLAFFSSVSSETTASGSESTAVATKALADNAINIAISQIVEATRSGTSSSVQSWASQPGMIRTYSSAGGPKSVYRLYSSDKLVLDLNGADYDGDPIPDQWKSPRFSQMYVDLNAPVMVSTSKDDTGSEVMQPNYPILDPRGAGTKDSANNPAQGLIAGFYLPSSAAPIPGGGASGTISPSNNDAPMPVRWLYVLENGSIVPGEEAGNDTVMVPGAASSPIKGRIAFWTDDESSKININTASEGVYWDMPHIVTYEDIGQMTAAKTVIRPGLSICQPAKGEYQRYPGHPATTSLSPVLAGYGMAVPDPAVAPAMSDAAKYEQYYSILPRVSTGGSKGGTAVPDISNTTGSSKAVYPTSSRLFASVDEFVFSLPTSAQGARQNSSAAITKDMLEQSKFFLTANSNAPEVTVFNTPRISMWPEATEVLGRTTFDNTIAYCASLGYQGTTSAFPYYFQRKVKLAGGVDGSRSMTEDASIPRNQVLYSYLQKMFAEKVPGYPGSLRGSIGGTDTDQLIVNIMDYIRCTNIYDSTPGAKPYTTLTTLLTTKYGKSEPPNGAITSSDAGAGEVLPLKLSETLQGFGRFMTVREVSLVFYATNWDRNWDKGIKDTSPEDDANRPKLRQNASEMGCVLAVSFGGVMQGLPSIAPNMAFKVDWPNGLPTVTPTGGATQTLFTGSSGAINFIENAPVRFPEGRGIGGSDDPSMTFGKAGAYIFWGGMKQMRNANGKTRGNYPFFTFPYINLKDPNSAPAPAPRVQPPATFAFSGGDAVITLYAAEDGAFSNPIQIFNLKFPPATLPTPKVLGENAGGPQLPIFGQTPTAAFNGPGGPGGSTIKNFQAARDRFFTVNQDTVISLEIAGERDEDPLDVAKANFNSSAGDSRLFASRREVGNLNFHAHQDYANPIGVSIPDARGGKAYGMMRGSGEERVFPGARSGVLAKGMFPTYQNTTATYGTLPSTTTKPNYQTRRPNVPSRITAGPDARSIGVTRVKNDESQPGDWDTGYGMQKDGPYINMPDLGDVSFVDIDDKNGQLRYPYLTKEDHYLSEKGGGNYFSPNRQIPSSIMLGSLPTRVWARIPWTTILFNPKPEDPKHPGQAGVGNTPDHLIADFFWMPVVEPYAISQPFTTAGKINMNYQIQPFTYIKRATGLYALMKSTKFMAMEPALYVGSDPRPNTDQSTAFGAYKITASKTRFAIDIPATLAQFDDKFEKDIFKTASEICEINLIPKNAGVSSSSGMAAFWQKYSVTGDNLREKPYADLYPRLTTKSNTYTVHFRVQSLKKSPNTPAGQFVGGKDQITGEYRGSSIIERYIDINDPLLASPKYDFASQGIGKINIDDFYKIRVVNTKRFAP